MTADKNAACVAVKVAACLDTAAKAQPQDVFDCIAMDLPRAQWGQAMSEPAKKQTSAEQRHQVAVNGLIQIEALIDAILRLTPAGPESCAIVSLLHRANQVNTAVLGAIVDDGEDTADLQKVVNACLK